MLENCNESLYSLIELQNFEIFYGEQLEQWKEFFLFKDKCMGKYSATKNFAENLEWDMSNGTLMG